MCKLNLQFVVLVYNFSFTFNYKFFTKKIFKSYTSNVQSRNYILKKKAYLDLYFS